MLSTKRKLGHSGLERRVRPRKEEDSDVEVDSDDAPSEQAVSDDKSDEDEDESEAEDESEEESDGESVEEEKEPQLDISSVSFGDLAKAHAALSKSKSSKDEEPKSHNAKDWPSSNPKEKKEKQKRSSKHAPTEMSSKRPVSRKRDFLASDTKPAPRDPRFDPLSGKVNEGHLKRAYAFLDSYRDDEMAALKKEIKKAKNPARKEELKRQLLSMETKKTVEQKREHERKILEEHRNREKELVKEGKKPFYLKRSEQKKMLLMEKFKDMSEGQVEKAIMRRRKKIAGKDKKEMANLEKATERRRMGGNR